jgi:hypothetical protein
MRNTNDKLAEIAYPQLQDDSLWRQGRVGSECADHGAFALVNKAQISENAKFI